MPKVIVYFAHPGQKHSAVNRLMAEHAGRLDDISFVDLYRDYPRADIDVGREQQRLLDHDVIVFQFPLFWYSTPSLLKEWQDLVLEQGFAYGEGGDRLAGKSLMLAVTGAAPAEAYAEAGYQHFPLRTFLTPLEQTARLCSMRFLPPYVLFSSLKAAEAGVLRAHVDGYLALLTALCGNRYDHAAAAQRELVHYDSLPILQAGG